MLFRSVALATPLKHLLALLAQHSNTAEGPYAQAYETVSRTFSKFQDEGLISVQIKHMQIANIPGLKKIMGRVAAA